MQQDLNNSVKTCVLTPEEMARGRGYSLAFLPLFSDQTSFHAPIYREQKKKPPEPYLSIMIWEYEGTPEDKEREERENVPIFNRKYRYYPVNIPYKKFHTRPDTGMITAIDIMVEKKEEKF